MKRQVFEPTDLRRRAEAQIALGDLPSKSNLDPVRLLHELQVHKIELELQNEELISANLELTALRRRFEALYRHAPCGYLTLSMEGAVLEANDRALAMLKRDMAALSNTPLQDCLVAESLPAFEDMLAAARAGACDADADNLLIRRPHGVPIYAKLHCRRLELDDEQPLMLLALMDVSALKYAMDDVISSLKR